MKEKMEKGWFFTTKKIGHFLQHRKKKKCLCLHHYTNGSNNVDTATISTLHNYISLDWCVIHITKIKPNIHECIDFATLCKPKP